jgi:hypothetical protein
MIMFGEMLRANHLRKKAMKNSLAGEAASARLKYLGQALNDPVKYPPANSELGYLAIVHDVLRNKSAGNLLTARDHIEYSDSSAKIQFSCSEVTGASAGSNVHISYKNEGKHSSLVVRPTTKDKGAARMILGDIYTACPKLTQ